MNITVKTFASISDLCGFRERNFEIPEGSALFALIDLLVQEFPDLKEARKNLLMAVNEEYSGGERILCPDDVIALFPPVSGG